MEQTPEDSIDIKIATQLRVLRQNHGWTLETLASNSGISKSTLSRLEKADVSATTILLARLCSTYGITLSRLIYMAEENNFTPLILNNDQEIWTDPDTGFIRRSLSPPTGRLRGEVLECIIPADTTITYAQPPQTGLEHHLVMQAGKLTLTLDDKQYVLNQGDCLRYQLSGSSSFQTSPDHIARYQLFIL
ncbi:helix-turn-helix domain-containing protein [Thalassospira sp.]|uniref:helix-turn-helix domain-containing protein n=1 Tax=Thalassospira sp. TaxID=1912094 RepID=UPI003AA7C4FD